ncbi:von Willebrand factor-like [Clytia hemisphaerica]|uniref:CTCK domain-containing protein n=1 Tax=Clytia hemisphaerica TaxID=252671 RepID=A0A7M5USW0_9CNID
MRKIFLLLMAVVAAECMRNDIEKEVLQKLQDLATCALRKIKYTHTKGDCTASVEVNYCNGKCVSYTKYKEDYPFFEMNCKCCRVTETEQKPISMKCGKHGLKYQVVFIDEPKKCECTKCNSEEELRKS